MNNEFLSYIKGKDITLLGVGISNAPLAKKLIAWGAGSVTVCDKKPKEELFARFPFLRDIDGLKFACGEDYLSGIGGDLIIKTPGIRFDVPELLSAKERGSEISSEMELFFRFCPAFKIAVTGSDGKSTTTTLVYEMLKAEGKYRVFLGGNIGEPLLYRINDIVKEDIVVAELSSFQLHNQNESPDIGIITNIAPNHLDWHTSFEEYMDAKASIFTHQSEKGIAILNADNENSQRYLPLVKGKLRMFSRKTECDGVYLKDGMIFVDGKEYMDSKRIKLLGLHNVENYMAAIAAVKDFVSVESVIKVAENFSGVKHRLQLVLQKDGVKYYNSSIDSSPSRTNAALGCFTEKNVIIILGGKDKNVPFDSLSAELAKKTKYAVLTGAAAGKIKSDVMATKEYGDGLINFVDEPDFEKAVRLAASLAAPGDIVLLSPACTSFDRFANFEERGNFFTQTVNLL